MKVQLSNYAGFCNGVQNAYEKIKEAVASPTTKRPIAVLGSLVHNEDVVSKIGKMGVGKIKFDGNSECILDDIENSGIKTVVITAHGVAPEVYETLKSRNVEIIDTTCAKVIKAQRLAKVFFDRGCQIVVVGESKHKEVIGICGWGGNKPVVVEERKDVEFLNLNNDNDIVILSQTTQNEDKVREIIEYILEKYPQAEVMDTVCSATKNRQSEIREIADKNDVVLVIGSKDSSNSNRLFEIAKEINPKTYFIERFGDIDATWFLGAKNVGISAGASTPRWIIKEVVEYVESL